MAIWFDLMDTESANLIGDFATEEAALALVAAYIRENGRAAVASWAMARMSDDRASDRFIAEGDALADLATREHAVAD